METGMAFPLYDGQEVMVVYLPKYHVPAKYGIIVGQDANDVQGQYVKVWEASTYCKVFGVLFAPIEGITPYEGGLNGNF